MKPPKLRPNESSKSFKARVKAWERATGKKFPRTFSGKTDEERVLGGAVRIGLDKKKDYSTNYGDEIKESQAEKARETQASKSNQQVKDEKKESFLEQAGKTDYSKVPLPTQKTKLQVKNSPRKPSPEWGVKKNNEKLKSGNSKEDKSEAQLKWEKESKNSPARASGAFSDKQLWEQRKKHKAWLEKRKNAKEERRKRNKERLEKKKKSLKIGKK